MEGLCSWENSSSSLFYSVYPLSKEEPPFQPFGLWHVTLKISFQFQSLLPKLNKRCSLSVLTLTSYTLLAPHWCTLHQNTFRYFKTQRRVPSCWRSQFMATFRIFAVFFKIFLDTREAPIVSPSAVWGALLHLKLLLQYLIVGPIYKETRKSSVSYSSGNKKLQWNGKVAGPTKWLPGFSK